MNITSSFIKELLTVVFCVFICENLSCGLSKNTTLQKGMNLIASLCLFITILSPIFNIISIEDIESRLKTDINFTEQNTDNGDSGFYDLVIDDMENSLKNQITEKFGIVTDSVCIQFNVSDKSLDIQEVSVVLAENNYTDTTKIHKYLMSVFTDKTAITITEQQDE